MDVIQSAESACLEVDDILASYPSQKSRRRLKGGTSDNELANLERHLRKYLVELEACADQVCQSADALANALDIEAIESDEGDLADPDGKLKEKLKRTETHLRSQGTQFDAHFRELSEAGVPDSHGVFVQHRRASDLHKRCVSALQEVRWSLMIHDGFVDAARSPDRRTFTSASEWMASLRGK